MRRRDIISVEQLTQCGAFAVPGDEDDEPSGASQPLRTEAEAFPWNFRRVVHTDDVRCAWQRAALRRFAEQARRVAVLAKPKNDEIELPGVAQQRRCRPSAVLRTELGGQFAKHSAWRVGRIEQLCAQHRVVSIRVTDRKAAFVTRHDAPQVPGHSVGRQHAIHPGRRSPSGQYDVETAPAAGRLAGDCGKKFGERRW